ncbi:MAG: FG-GAP repeat domain-containing protein, partial [Myxococcota bacterium]
PGKRTFQTACAGIPNPNRVEVTGRGHRRDSALVGASPGSSRRVDPSATPKYRRSVTNALPRRVGSVSRHATLTAVVLSVAAGGLSAQSLPFVDFGSIRPDSQGPHEVVDIDGDGDLDLLRAYSSGFSSASVELLVNDGRGSFSAAGAPLPVGYRVTAMACEDFDGDGRQDLAVAS